MQCSSSCGFIYLMVFGVLEDFKHPTAPLGCKSSGKPCKYWHWSDEEVYVYSWGLKMGLRYVS